MAEVQVLGALEDAGMVTAANPQVADIRAEWGWVKKGVEEVLEEHPQLTYRAEDVYAAVLSKAAILWVADEGFVVSTIEVDPFNNEKTFLIWIAWAKHRGGKSVLKYYPFFEAVAQEHGIQHMEVRTPIPEMEGLLSSAGWNKDTVIYTRRL